MAGQSKGGGGGGASRGGGGPVEVKSYVREGHQVKAYTRDGEPASAAKPPGVAARVHAMQARAHDAAVAAGRPSVLAGAASVHAHGPSGHGGDHRSAEQSAASHALREVRSGGLAMSGREQHERERAAGAAVVAANRAASQAHHQSGVLRHVWGSSSPFSVDRFEGDHAVLVNEHGDTRTVARSALGQNVRAGDVLGPDGAGRDDAATRKLRGEASVVQRRLNARAVEGDVKIGGESKADRSQREAWVAGEQAKQAERAGLPAAERAAAEWADREASIRATHVDPRRGVRAGETPRSLEEHIAAEKHYFFSLHGKEGDDDRE